MTDQQSASRQIKEWALEAGFDLVGIAAAETGAPERHYESWIAQGMHGDMAYLERGAAKRGDPDQVLPGVRSIVVLARSYLHPVERPQGSGGGRVSRYAWGDDYHDVLLPGVRELESRIRSAWPGSDTRGYVDTGPVMEKAWAQRAGLGWIGKNGCLITTEFGSWVFLAVVLTTLELAVDPAHPERCGSCDICIPACPTGAICSPGVVDARSCIAYTTIEHRGVVRPDIAADHGDWVFGCDVCQDVCPWNVEVSHSTEEAFGPREEFLSPSLEDLVSLEDEAWWELRRGSPIQRAKRAGMVRNGVIALHNAGGARATRAIITALADSDPTVRSQAALALREIGSVEAIEALDVHRRTETDPDVVNVLRV